MLAKVVNDNAGNLTPRIALRFFASKLAPTGMRVCSGAGQERLPILPRNGSDPLRNITCAPPCRSELAREGR